MTGARATLSAGGESGSATVWAAAWILALMQVALLGVVVGAAVARQHRLDAGADLASLAAAAALQAGGAPCVAGRRTAEANHATLVRCLVDGRDVVVVVVDRLELPFGIRLKIRSTARAGPGAASAEPVSPSGP
ncbi:MAG TPA: Rv3654c family TadE-like protein [Nocardioidaceae bacterium]|nr:Rv3654c family TadE-like protein [Nocardioidaceae bacterium]